MSNIEWTDATWNPVIGCTPVSPGCLNCYAATMARRLEAMGKKEYQPRKVEVHTEDCQECQGTGRDDDTGDCQICRGCMPLGRTIRIAEVKNGRAVFTGEVRCLPERLTEPLHWNRPRMVFVNSMSDLFHEAVPFEFIDRVFAVMALCPQHTFQVLTKRPERMAEYLDATVSAFDGAILRPRAWERMCSHMRAIDEYADPTDLTPWPLPNLWLGTSGEDQDRANERVPHLMRCPAAVRFLSCEPLLGAVDLDACGATPCDAVDGFPDTIGCPKPCPGVNWVIVGGESGPHARPCDVAWIRSIVRQCAEAGVPCFVKQLGAVPMNGPFRQQPVTGKIDSPAGGNGRRFVSRKGADPAEWPEDLRVRQFPEVRR